MLNYGRTRIIVADDAADLGRRAASMVAELMRELLRREDEIRMIFAAAESQNTFFDALARQRELDWGRVVCFNMDDFWEPRMPREFTCGHHTRTHLYEKVRPRRFELVRFDAPDPDAEVARYAKRIRDAGPFHILCQGIGRSGHLALNEPGSTDLHDPQLVRLVDLVEESKRQLREDPHFGGLGYVPEKGITMTVPSLMAAAHRFTMAPYASKRPIMARLLATREPTAELPASVLLEHEGVLFVDHDSWPG